MPTFQSPEQLYTVLQDVFKKLAEQPEHIETFTRSNLVIRMNFTNPHAEVLLDGRQPPFLHRARDFGERKAGEAGRRIVRHRGRDGSKSCRVARVASMLPVPRGKQIMASEPARPLDGATIKSFIDNGFVRIDEAFPKELAEEARAILWRDTGCDPEDRSTWTRPVIRLGQYSQPPFRDAASEAGVGSGRQGAGVTSLAGFRVAPWTR